MNAIDFHDKMHTLIFRGSGASRLGAVQTTVVWQFVIFHYEKLESEICSELILRQEKINALPCVGADVETAITELLNRVNELNVARRPFKGRRIIKG